MNNLESSIAFAGNGHLVKEPVSCFAISIRQPNKIRLINVGTELAQCIKERLEQLIQVDTSGHVIFKDYMQISFAGRFNIYDIILKKQYFLKPDGGKTLVTREDATLINVAFCRILSTLFCYGYDVEVSSDLARDNLSHATVFFRPRDPYEDRIPLHYYSHKFICVSPYSTDSILLINIPKVAVEAILKIIHLTWSPGIKSKQTLADDERSVSVVISLKLSGSPWNKAAFNSGKATIQARLIILEVTRILAAYKWRFATNINFSGTTDSFFYQWCPNLDLDEYRHCAIILSRYDRLRMLHVPTNLIPVIKECTNKFWYLQIIKQKDYHGTTELKLGGCPWWAEGNDAVESRYFISSLIGALKASGWAVAGTINLSRHNNDKSTFLLRRCHAQFQPHMCISFNRANRIRLIVGSSDICEEAELQLTSRINDIIKQRWVALGPRNYGKSVEWKLEGDPWDSEGLYSDHTRGIYLLCRVLDGIRPLGWKLVSSADISSKNVDGNERGNALVGKPEDVHTWFFLYDVSMRRAAFPLVEAEVVPPPQMSARGFKKDISCSSSALNSKSGDEILSHKIGPLAHQHLLDHYCRCSSRQQVSPQQWNGLGIPLYPQTNLQSNRSRSVPSIADTGNSSDPHLSHNSLYGSFTVDGQYKYDCDHQGPYSPDNRTKGKTFSTFRSATLKPCVETEKYSTLRKTALASHDQRGQGFKTPINGKSSCDVWHTSNDFGYKSDAEGYESERGGNSSSCGNQQFERGHHQRKQDFCSYGMTSQEGIQKITFSGTQKGFLSDGEGHIFQQQQNWSGTQLCKREDSLLSLRGSSRSLGELSHPREIGPIPTTDGENNLEKSSNEETQIEAPGHLKSGGKPAASLKTNSLRLSTEISADVTSISNVAGNVVDDPNITISYSAFQAGGQGNSCRSNLERRKSGSCQELYKTKVTEAAVKRSCSGGRIVDTSIWSQRNSRNNCFDGYRSEVTSVSPERQDQSIPTLIYNKEAGHMKKYFHHLQPRFNDAHNSHPGRSCLPIQALPCINLNLKQQQATHEPSCYSSRYQCATSSSMHSFQRQESSTSFQSGHSMISTNSDPLCLFHHPPQRHHMHMSNNPSKKIESSSTQSSSSSASAPADYATCSTRQPLSDQVLSSFSRGGCKTSRGDNRSESRTPQIEKNNYKHSRSPSRMSRPESLMASNPKAQMVSANPTGPIEQSKTQETRSNKDFYYMSEFYG